MSNTCYNYLTISENKSDDILKYVLNDNNLVDFGILIPMPDDVKLLNHPDRGTPYKGERDWAWTTIGTPGLADSTNIDTLDDGSTYITFDSQWSPPNVWFDVLSTKVVDLDTDDKNPVSMDLEYAEHDMGFGGKIEYTKQLVNESNSFETIYTGTQLDDLLGLPDLVCRL